MCLNYNMPRPFKVRDFREKHFHLVDDVYLNGYAKHFDPHTTAVYLSLCRHADKDQLCFPSQRLIAKEHNIGERTVRDKLELLEKWNIIQREKGRNKVGKWLNTTYILLDKSLWKKPSANVADGRKLPSHRQELPIKDTHKKDTHIINIGESPLKRFSSLEEVSEEVIAEISARYRVPIGFVKLQREKMANWLVAKGKRYKNYKMALMNWVLRAAEDKIERRQNDKYRAVDARHIE